MKQETSYGIIPLKKRAGVWHVLLIKHKSGDHWSFPKGHFESGESPKETAIRELKEETGLKVHTFLTDHELKENYQFVRDGEQIDKTVTYFIAEVEGDIFLNYNELLNGKWIPLFEAEAFITHKEARDICHQVINLFNNFLV